MKFLKKSVKIANHFIRHSGVRAQKKIAFGKRNDKRPQLENTLTLLMPFWYLGATTKLISQNSEIWSPGTKNAWFKKALKFFFFNFLCVTKWSSENGPRMNQRIPSSLSVLIFATKVSASEIVGFGENEGEYRFWKIAPECAVYKIFQRFLKKFVFFSSKIVIFHALKFNNYVYREIIITSVKKTFLEGFLI